MSENEEIQFPSLLEQGKNLTKSVAKVAKSTIEGIPIFAPYNTQKERLDICNECEYLDKESTRCIQCGCNIKWKISYSSSECPKRKWHGWQPS